MTEKEIAEKVWDLLDKQLVSASRTFDDTWKEYHLGCRDCLATTMEELEKILPRPKRRVKKTLKRWVAVYKNPNGSILTGGTFECQDSIDNNKGERDFKRICHLEEIGRKEIEITLEVEE